MDYLGSSFASCSSASSSSEMEGITLLKWQDCHSPTEIIGFIVGTALNYSFRATKSLFDLTAKVLPFGRIANLFAQAFSWTKATSSYYLNRMCEISKNCIKAIFINKMTKALGNGIRDYILNPIGRCIRKVIDAVKWVWNTLIAPIYTKFIKPIGSALSSVVSKLFNKCFDGCRTLCKTIADWTVVPLYKRLLSPLMEKIAAFVCKQLKSIFDVISPIASKCFQSCWSVTKTIFNWTIKPLFKRALIPFFQGIYNLALGIISGCFQTNAKEDSKVDADKGVSGNKGKDDREVESNEEDSDSDSDTDEVIN